MKGAAYAVYNMSSTNCSADQGACATLIAWGEMTPFSETEMIYMTRNQTASNPLILNGCEGQVQYQSEVTTAKLGDREIHLENLTPILSPKEHEERKREIESRLYNVFAKYANKSDKK